VRSILAAQPNGAETVIITDLEAGLEHLSRSTSKASEVMLVVAEPYYKSLETASRTVGLARELGIPEVYVVANKVRTPREAEALDAFCTAHDLPLLATIPYDEAVMDAELAAQAPLDFCCDGAAVQAIGALADRLRATPAV
jgi:CO dehydrogenase maturation factor